MNKLKITFLVIIVFQISIADTFIYAKTKKSPHNDRNQIIKTAKKYIGKKYTYGGKSAKGFDCSGFVMYVFKENGIMIPRMSKNQFKKGKKINKSKALKADLIFFRIKGNRISHVGIYLGNKKFIHSPSSGKKVSISSIENPYWKKKIAGFVTYFSKIHKKIN